MVEYLVLNFCGLFSIVWFLGLSLSRDKKIHSAGAGLILLSGLRLLWESGLYENQWIASINLFPWSIPFFYLFGPLIYLYSRQIMGESHRVSLWLFVLPFLLGVCGLFIWLFIVGSNGFPFLVEVFNSSYNTRSCWEWFLVIWIVGPKIVILLYLIPILSGYSKEVFLLYKELKSDMKWYVLSFFPSISVMVFFDAFGYLIGIPFFSRLSAQSHGALVIAVYLFSNYKPETISDISKALETIRYAKSKIIGINADSKLQAIDQLMREESLYADEDFRISQLAEISNLSVHQLSELLNSKLGIGFNEYINRFRIEEAALLLVNEPSRNVLSIAYAVGFNSKSAFNKMFRKQYGLTPSEYLF